MSQFNVGDKVRLIKPDGGDSLPGTIGEVVAMPGVWIDVMFEGRSQVLWYGREGSETSFLAQNYLEGLLTDEWEGNLELE